MNSSAVNIFFIGLLYDLAKKGTILQLQGIMNRKQTVKSLTSHPWRVTMYFHVKKTALYV